MIDYAAIEQGDLTLAHVEPHLQPGDLVTLTNEMIDDMLARIEGATDEMVTFTPDDPEAHDPYASDEEDRHVAWTLGHVIVHTTASAEESAFLAAEMARGVRPRGRSRYETPWQLVTTIDEVRQRLEESRRMRLASLEMWPDEPHLSNTFEQRRGQGPIGPVGRFLKGLVHDYSHLEQISKIVAQAREVEAVA